jgi:hypothetical protein
MCCVASARELVHFATVSLVKAECSSANAAHITPFLIIDAGLTLVKLLNDSRH